MKIINQEDRPTILAEALSAHPVNPTSGIYRKTARIVAVQLLNDAIVYTEHGPMEAKVGDYVATNHPDDDPGSDVWPISAERMANTYQKVEES